MIPESLVPMVAAGDGLPMSSERASYRQVLGGGEFRAIFAADIVSMLGNVVAAVALMVLVYQRTHSPALAASVMAGDGCDADWIGTCGIDTIVAESNQLARCCSMCADNARRFANTRLLSSLSERNWNP